MRTALSRRSYARLSSVSSWEELWEAGPYYERISELLENARHYAVLVGWQIDSRLPLRRPSRADGAVPAPETLKQKLIRLCQERPGFQVYVLMWSHAPIYVLERESWQARTWRNAHPRVHFVFDNRHSLGGSHHEKVCLIDGRIALCGGIDLCDDRWDTPEHLYEDPRRSLHGKRECHAPYHDLAVQVSGPICSEIHRHLAWRWRRISSIPFPKPLGPKPLRAAPPSNRATARPVYLSRTVAPVDARSRKAPSITREIEFLYRDLIESAESRIILEGQYYWSEQVNDLLIARMHRSKGNPLEIVLILADLRNVRSLTRCMSQHEFHLLQRLRAAASFSGTKLVLGWPYSYPSPGEALCRSPSPLGPLGKAVYVHSKALVIDDRFLSIGSANFTARALRLDTEVSLTLEARTPADHQHIRRFANRLLEHWDLARGDRGERSVALRPIAPLRLALERRASRWGMLPPNARETWLPWHRILDPRLPWMYLLKRRLLRLARNPAGFRALALSVLAATTASALGPLALATPLPRAPLPWIALYCGILSSSWLLPVPFVLTSAVAAAQLGPTLGGGIAVVSLLSASLWGYAASRAFPTLAARYHRRAGPRSLSRRIGRKRFPTLVSAMLDPRVGIRSKIAYQGVHCVPLPCFGLLSLVTLPSLLYLGLHLGPAAWVAILLANVILVFKQIYGRH